MQQLECARANRSESPRGSSPFARAAIAFFAALLVSCDGLVSELAGPAKDPHSGGATQVPGDGGAPLPVDAGNLEGADAGEEDSGAADAGDAGGSRPDAGPGPVLVDAGAYPGLPASCQGLVNHTHGACDDAYANPDYGSVVWSFKSEVEQAISDVGQPAALFSGDTVLVDKRDEYAALVAASLDTQGICAVWSGGELYVRDRIADLNETFSLFTAAGRPRAGGHWQCERSDEIPGTQPAFTCGLAPSAGTNCVAPGQNYFTDLVSIVDEVIVEEQSRDAGSAIIDFAFKTSFASGFRLRDDGYPFVAAVARKANARGYCVASSGWKWIDLKLGSNTLSEKFSLVTHQTLPGPALKPALYAACLSDGILPSCEFIIEKAEDTCRPADF